MCHPRICQDRHIAANLCAIILLVIGVSLFLGIYFGLYVKNVDNNNAYTESSCIVLSNWATNQSCDVMSDPTCPASTCSFTSCADAFVNKLPDNAVATRVVLPMAIVTAAWCIPIKFELLLGALVTIFSPRFVSMDLWRSMRIRFPNKSKTVDLMIHLWNVRIDQLSSRFLARLLDLRQWQSGIFSCDGHWPHETHPRTIGRSHCWSRVYWHCRIHFYSCTRRKPLRPLSCWLPRIRIIHEIKIRCQESSLLKIIWQTFYFSRHIFTTQVVLEILGRLFYFSTELVL